VRGSPALTSLGSGCALALERYVDLAAVFVRDFEHLPGLQVQEAGDEDFGDLADAGVVGVDVVVEKLPAVGDALFEFADAGLQLEEVVIGFELRIVLGAFIEAVRACVTASRVCCSCCMYPLTVSTRLGISS
jgi:hypothetical protein